MKSWVIWVILLFCSFEHVNAFEFGFDLDNPQNVKSTIRSKYRQDHVNYLYDANDRLADHYQSFLAKRDASYPLYANELALIHLAKGNMVEAQRLFLESYRIMNDVAGYGQQQKKAQSIFHSESVKVYKGDPYERMMNSFYLGMVYGLQEDWDNALACMKNALLSDSFGKNTDNYSDFVPLYVLASFIERKRGHEIKAEEQMKHAKSRYEGVTKRWNELRYKNLGEESSAVGSSHISFDKILQSPQLLICSLGRGPVKYRVGPYGEELRFARALRHWDTIEIFVDGKQVNSETISSGHNVFFQAVTRGERKMDGLLKRKVAWKGGLLAAGNAAYEEGQRKKKKGKDDSAMGLKVLGAILQAASVITNPSADARYWSLLPDEIVMCPLYLKEGSHTIKIVGRSLLGDSKVLVERDLDVVPASGLIVQEVRHA